MKHEIKIINKRNIVLSLFVLVVIGFIIINNINLNQKAIESSEIEVSEQKINTGKTISLSASDELNYESIPAYELIIEIIEAKHLDENKEFISDIYNGVKEQDNIWSEPISNNEYVRVFFETKLSSNNDITIYPRIVSGNPKIEIYEVDGIEKIAEFSSLNENQYNKVYLRNLTSVSQDIFDLRVIDGIIEFDHITDPVSNFSVDSYDGTRTEWANVGASPYLDVQDQPTNQVTASNRNLDHGDFNFSNLPAEASSINSVSFNIFADCGSEGMSVFLWDDGASGYVQHNLGACGSYSWNNFTATELTTVDEVNNAKFYVRTNGIGGWTGTASVDAANLTVDYNEQSDTCTAPGSGNWDITCSDNCTFNSDFSVPANITMVGLGIITLNANMTMSATSWQIYKDNGCTIIIVSGGSIR